MKAISSFVTMFQNSKLIGKIAIVGSALFFLCSCLSAPIGLSSNSTEEPTQTTPNQDYLTAIYETAQAEAFFSSTQTAKALTPEPTITLEPIITLTPLPTATLTFKEALFSNIASCVPRDTEFVEAYVVDVIDGNTIDVQVDTEIYRVRYIGVDTPEKGETLFEQATMANMNLVYSKKVVMIKDVSEIDYHNRLIRYVIVGDVFVNYELIKQGYALAVAYSPNVACADYFSDAQSDAQTNLVGLWSPYIK